MKVTEFPFRELILLQTMILNSSLLSIGHKAVEKVSLCFGAGVDLSSATSYPRCSITSSIAVLDPKSWIALTLKHLSDAV